VEEAAGDATTSTNGEPLLRPDFERLSRSGVIVGTVAIDTQAVVEARSGRAYHVRITSGPNTGLEGWVAPFFVRTQRAPKHN